MAVYALSSEEKDEKASVGDNVKVGSAPSAICISDSSDCEKDKSAKSSISSQKDTKSDTEELNQEAKDSQVIYIMHYIIMHAHLYMCMVLEHGQN